MLHRLFVQRHAMQIKGLQADGMDWKNVTTSKVLEEHGLLVSKCDLGIRCFGHLGFSGRSGQHERPHLPRAFRF